MCLATVFVHFIFRDILYAHKYKLRGDILLFEGGSREARISRIRIFKPEGVALGACPSPSAQVSTYLKSLTNRIVISIASLVGKIPPYKWNSLLNYEGFLVEDYGVFRSRLAFTKSRDISIYFVRCSNVKRGQKILACSTFYLIL